jgi:hypothetical protein
MREHSGQHLASPGEFIEFTAALRRNPLIEALDSVDEILDLVLLFQDPPTHQKKKTAQQGQPDLKRLQSQLHGLADSLKAGGTQDLVAELVESGGRAVLTVEQQALSDPSLSDLVDGTFRVMGKVIRAIPDSSGSVSLLRKTAMSKVPPQMLQTLTSAFGGLQQEHGFAMPTMEVEIPGPVFHVLPVAIFS